MPQSFFNFGSGLPTWIGLALLFVVLFFVTILAVTVAELIMVLTKKSLSRLRRIAIRNVILSSVALIVVIVSGYFSFGPGEPARIPPVTEDGMHNLVEQMPEEKRKEVIEKEAYEKKPEVLKRQDDVSFEKERREADEYIREALERAQK